MQEKKILDSPEPPTIEETRKALHQLQFSICKIFKANGTGFFCYIPYENKYLRVLMTNYHVIDEQFLKANNYIKIGINDEKFLTDINLNCNRKIYLNKEYDLSIIEIKDKDYLNEKIFFLNKDEEIFQKNSDSIFSTKNLIYILQYPNLRKARVAWGIIRKINNIEIKHLCSTEDGSSGSPILYIKTNKVIGIHKGYSHFNFNLGTFLKKPLKQLYQNHEMKPINQIKNSNNFNNQYSNNFTYNMINNVFFTNANNSNSYNQNNLNVQGPNWEKFINEKGENNYTNISFKPKTGELNQQSKFNKVVQYFPKSSYEGVSIVDALKEINVDSSQSYRSKIAAANGIENYKFLDTENLEMLKLLKEGKLIIP